MPLTVSGDLYSNVDLTLDRAAQEKFDNYCAKLEQITAAARLSSDPQASEKFSEDVQAFYSELVRDAFATMGVIPPIGLEICLSGSLAKKQATIYSDLDGFVITRTPEDAVRVQPVFQAVNNVLDRIFMTRNQLCPDPIQMNPARLLGTPKQITEKITSGAVPFEETACAILTSKPIGRDSRLHATLVADLQRRFPPQNLYRETTSVYTGPREGSPMLDIKADLLRPIDFMLMGLRAEFKIEGDVSAQATIAALRERKLLPEEQITLLELTFMQVQQLRCQTHIESGKEEDTVPRSPLTETLLRNVEQLRTIALARKTNLEETAAAKSSVSAFTKAKQKFRSLFGSSNSTAAASPTPLSAVSPTSQSGSKDASSPSSVFTPSEQSMNSDSAEGPSDQSANSDSADEDSPESIESGITSPSSRPNA